MRGRGLLFSSDGEPRLVVPGIIGVIVAFVVSLAAITLTNRPRTEQQRADALMRSGRPARAEQLYAKLLRDNPSVPLALSLLDAHEQARLFAKMAELREDSHGGGGMGLPDPEAPMNEEAIDELLAALPEEMSLIARFARGIRTRQLSPELRERVTAGAERDPPMPWANHMLGREAQRTARHADAAEFFEKEGVTFPDRSDNVDIALHIWLALDAWDTLRERLADPRVVAIASPQIKYKLAVHDRDWRAAARWLPAVWAPQLGGTGLAMSAITALAWAFFCARLGKL
ncbi:MAG TPA: hypothetical protein VM580_03915, partial [Labilithrix sp.]|nr:hypothetical protein [Labilithrix sp.]